MVVPAVAPRASADDNLQPNIYAAALVCWPLAVLSVALRVAARRMQRTPLGYDDYTIIIGLALATTVIALLLYATFLGMGRHTEFVPSSNVVPLLQVVHAAEALAMVSLFVTKASILLLYHRIFPGRRFAMVLWAAGIFIGAYSILAVVADYIGCQSNIEWDGVPVEVECLAAGPVGIVLAVLTVVTDFGILVLPLPLLWRLQMSTTCKFQIMGMFLLGSLACVGGVVRVVYNLDYATVDGTWRDAYILIWAVVELCLAVVGACLPMLRIVYRRARHLGSSKASYDALNHTNYSNATRLQE